MLQAAITFFGFIIIGLWIRREKSHTETSWTERLLMGVATIIGMVILVAMFCFTYWLVYNHTIWAFLLLVGLLVWAWYDNRGQRENRR